MVGVFAGGSSLGSFAAGAEPGVVCSFDEHAADTADTATVVTDNSTSGSSSSSSKRAAGLVLHGEQLTAAELVSDMPLCFVITMLPMLFDACAVVKHSCAAHARCTCFTCASSSCTRIDCVRSSSRADARTSAACY
jgi:hypothetical protein